MDIKINNKEDINKLKKKIEEQHKIIEKQNIKINNLENIINYNKSNIDLILRIINNNNL